METDFTDLDRYNKNAEADADAYGRLELQIEALVDTLKDIALTAQQASQNSPEQFCEWAYHTVTATLTKYDRS